MNRPLTIARNLVLLLCSGTALAWAEVGLAERLVSRDPAVRTPAIQEFQSLPSEAKERFVPSLMVAMSDEDKGLRLDAARLMRGMGISSDKTARDLRKEMPKKGESSRVTAYKEVQASKKEEFPDLRAALKEERQTGEGLEQDSTLRPNSRQSGLAESLLESLNDEDPLVRAHGARQLSKIQPIPAEALPRLIELLHDEDSQVRSSAASAIASIGPSAQSAIPSLMKLAGDPDPRVRAVASDALKELQVQR